jgi:hypothetical protein
MNTINLLQTFLEGAGLENDTLESVAIGTMKPADCRNGVDSIMQYYTTYIDNLIEQSESDTEKIQLQSVRGITFSEYQLLFDLSIHENDFHKFSVFRHLWLNNEKERRRFIYHLSKDSHENYMNVLLQSLCLFDAHFLLFFFFGKSRYRVHFFA